MSDIWHKAGFHEAIDDKLKVSKEGKWVYWTMYGWNIPGKDAHDIGCEWAYLDDLLALETELERTRKALDVLLFTINRLENQNYKDCAWHLRLAIAKIEASGIAKKALDKITTLEQKESAFVHNKIKFPEYNDNLLEEFDKQFFENGQDDDLTEIALEQKD